MSMLKLKYMRLLPSTLWPDLQNQVAKFWGWPKFAICTLLRPNELVEELKLSSREMPPCKTENINHGGYDFLKNW